MSKEGIAYGYMRYSTDRQGEGSSESQKKVIEELWEKHCKAEYPTLVLFLDEDVSARQNEFRSRPKAKELALRLRPQDAVIFSKLDRGFRNLRDMLNCLHNWDQLGVRVFCSDFGMGQIYDSKSMIGKLSLVLFGIAAEMEGHRASQRQTDFNNMRRKRGQPTSNSPYGYKIVRVERDGHTIDQKGRVPAWLQPDDYERAILDTIWWHKQRGIGGYKLAKFFKTAKLTMPDGTEREIRDRRGRMFTANQISAVYDGFIPVKAAEESFFATRKRKLYPFEFITPDGVLMPRFDKQHLREEYDRQQTAKGETDAP